MINYCSQCATGCCAPLDGSGAAAYVQYRYRLGHAGPGTGGYLHSLLSTTYNWDRKQDEWFPGCGLNYARYGMPVSRSRCQPPAISPPIRVSEGNGQRFQRSCCVLFFFASLLMGKAMAGQRIDRKKDYPQHDFADSRCPTRRPDVEHYQLNAHADKRVG